MITPNEDSSGEACEALRALLAMLDTQLDRRVFTNNREADDLFSQAMEAETDEEQLELLGEVLEVDPAHIDALLVFMDFLGLEVEEEISVLRRVVDLAARRLGEKLFKESEGHFWMIFETRPYMHARGRLAETLRFAGQTDEANSEWEGMLKLNPGDNQGVRYGLLAGYLELGELSGAKRLFKQYDECDCNAVFAWGKVLACFLDGSEQAALKALDAAREQNPHMEGYLTRRKRLPKQLPIHYAMGSKEEAACYADTVVQAWGVHPDAQKWLVAATA